MNSRDGDLPEAPDSPVVRLRKAIIAAAERDGSGSGPELAAAARDLVTELRGQNRPPEQVLLRIKEILAEAGLRPGHTLAADGSELISEAALYRDVIAASIRYYFENAERDRAASGE
jgi:hypothetical protein